MKTNEKLAIINRVVLAVNIIGLIIAVVTLVKAGQGFLAILFTVTGGILGILFVFFLADTVAEIHATVSDIKKGTDRMISMEWQNEQNRNKN